MTGKGHISRRRYIYQVMKYLFLILAFSCLLFLIIITSYFSSSKKELLSKYHKSIESAAHVLGMQFQTALNQGNLLFSDPAFIMYFKPQNRITEYERSEVNNVVRALSDAEAQHFPFVMNEFVFYTGDDKVLTSGGHYDKDLFFGKIFRFSSYTSAFFESFPRKTAQFILPETEVDAHGNGSFVSVIPIITTTPRFGALAVHMASIDATYIKSLLSLETLSYSYRIHASDGTLLLSSDDNADYDPSSPLYYTFTDFSSLLQFETMISTSAVFTDQKLLMLSFTLLFILCAFGGALVIYLSRLISQPIHDIYKIIPEAMKDGNGNELTAIHHGVENLIDSERTMQELNILHQFSLFLQGIKSTDPAALSSSLARLFSLSSPPYFSISILLISASPLAEKISAIRSYLESVLCTIGPLALLTIDSNLYECIFSLKDGDSPESLAIALSSCLGQASEELEASAVLVGISDAYQSLEKADEAHKEDVKALPSLKGDEKLSIALFKETPKKKSISFSYYDQTGIINSIAAGKREALIDYVRSIMERNRKRSISLIEMGQVYRQILLSGKLAAEQVTFPMEKIENFTHIYEAAATPQNNEALSILEKAVLDILTEIQTKAFPPKEEEHNLNINAIDTYIESNYQHPFSLDDIGDALGLTSKYISSLYKEETGQNLSYAISRYRMEKAKSLLLSTTMNVGEIAENVGIDSRATFLRLFRKLEGITPTAYKALNDKGAKK